MIQKRKKLVKSLVILPLLIFCIIFSSSSTASAMPLSVPTRTVALSQCGANKGMVITAIDFGCTGAQCYRAPGGPPPATNSGYCSGNHSALVDLLFAVIRFLTDGIGLVIIMSLIIAGIQYTTSQGDPSAIKHATERIRSASTALALFIFAYAILNYIIPNGFFGQ